uniref:Uncharacterized protein n=1 Tax=Oryza glumipatula TaxID=40148 RepID=A0A0D9Y7K5_9ORYZ
MATATGSMRERPSPSSSMQSAAHHCCRQDHAAPEAHDSEPSVDPGAPKANGGGSARERAPAAGSVKERVVKSGFAQDDGLASRSAQPTGQRALIHRGLPLWSCLLLISLFAPLSVGRRDRADACVLCRTSSARIEPSPVLLVHHGHHPDKTKTCKLARLCPSIGSPLMGFCHGIRHLPGWLSLAAPLRRRLRCVEAARQVPYLPPSIPSIGGHVHLPLLLSSSTPILSSIGGNNPFARIVCQMFPQLGDLPNSTHLPYQVKPMMKNQKEDKSETKGTKKKADKGANKLGAAQASS